MFLWKTLLTESVLPLFFFYYLFPSSLLDVKLLDYSNDDGHDGTYYGDDEG